jgi:hypothetical protein
MEAATTPRVLTVTESPTLVIGLAFLPQDWDVVSQPALGTGIDADVVVIDLGTTMQAVEALAAFDEELPPVVIVGDTDAGDLPNGVKLLLRPYTLDQLARLVSQLLHPEPDEGEPVATDGALEDPDRGISGRALGHTAPAIENATARADAGPTDIAAGDTGAMDISAAERLTGWVRRLATPRGHAASGEDEDRGRPFGDATSDEWAGAEGDPASLEAIADPVGTAPDALDTERRRQGGPGARPVVDGPKRTAERRGRWIGRRPLDDRDEGDLQHRLAGALTASAELERLVIDLPLLRSSRALALAVTTMVQEQLRADTVAVWRPRADGWHVAAARGLSPIEAAMVVAPTHPLFTEIDASGGALLIDPVDSVQGIVAGVGGAHTESFMAASISVGPGRYGIVTAGRDDPLRGHDLDTLIAMVLEAALGFALADWFERMAVIAERDRPHGRTERQDDPGVDDTGQGPDLHDDVSVEG